MQTFASSSKQSREWAEINKSFACGEKAQAKEALRLDLA
jgi:hypothetical protein